MLVREAPIVAGSAMSTAAPTLRFTRVHRVKDAATSLSAHPASESPSFVYSIHGMYHFHGTLYRFLQLKIGNQHLRGLMGELFSRGIPSLCELPAFARDWEPGKKESKKKKRRD